MGWTLTRQRLIHKVPVVMRVSFIHSLFWLVAILASGCSSTLCLVSKQHLQKFEGGANSVYVTNPQQKYEFEILKASGIYRLSDAPANVQTLTLRPLKRGWRCANPLMLSILTCGIIPGVLPGAYSFEYEIEINGRVERFVHHLPVYERYSIWEWLVIDCPEETLAEALAWSVPKLQPVRE